MTVTAALFLVRRLPGGADLAPVSRRRLGLQSLEFACMPSHFTPTSINDDLRSTRRRTWVSWRHDCVIN